MDTHSQNANRRGADTSALEIVITLLTFFPLNVHHLLLYHNLSLEFQLLELLPRQLG